MTYVVLFGSPCGGFKIHGPFPTEEAANKFGEDMGEGGEWVMPVHAPPAAGEPVRLYPWSGEAAPQPFTVPGFDQRTTGGGCLALSREVGTAEVLVTDGSGVDLPKADDWMICAYDEDGAQVAGPFVPGSYASFAEALAAATTAAETADMEQSARRRGDLQQGN